MGRVLEWDITVPFRWTCGEIYGSFLGGLKNKKILGIKCKSCKKVYVPPQEICPECYEDWTKEDMVEVKDEGVVLSFTKIYQNFFGEKPSEEYLTKRIEPANYKDYPLLWMPEVPYAIVIVKLDGADTGFLHIVKKDEMEKLEIGKKVAAIWREERTGEILDIDSFKVI
jgi:uncharacterized OB-fold protein